MLKNRKDLEDPIFKPHFDSKVAKGWGEKMYVCVLVRVVWGADCADMGFIISVVKLKHGYFWMCTQIFGLEIGVLLVL